MRDQILVLNFNSSYAAAIAEKLRAEKIFCKIIPGDTTAEGVISEEALGVILAGGLTSVIPTSLDGQLLRTGIPVLALGDAAAAVAALLGGDVGEGESVNGVAPIKLYPSRITESTVEAERLLGTVFPFGLNGDLEPLVEMGDITLGLMHKALDIYALQFQLEPNDPDMMNLLLRFSLDVCGCTAWWGEDAFISMSKAEIADTAGEGNAVCVMSGGLDSGVAALLAHRALGARLQCLFVDTGLLRENEVEDFAAYYKNAGLNLQIVRAEQRFLNGLKGITRQSDKRKAVLDTLLAVLDETLRELPYDLLIQTNSSNTAVFGDQQISSAPRIQTDRPTVTPLGGLFKDEIRLVGEALGMPQEMTKMQSFPWTGLALRVMGECTKDKLDLLRRADAVFTEEIRNTGLGKRLWKYFAVLCDVPFHNEPGNAVIALRAVSANHQGSDVRAIPARLPYDLLERYTERIRSAHSQVIKVVYDLTPGSSLQQIEWY